MCFSEHFHCTCVLKIVVLHMHLNIWKTLTSILGWFICFSRKEIWFFGARRVKKLFLTWFLKNILKKRKTFVNLLKRVKLKDVQETFPKKFSFMDSVLVAGKRFMTINDIVYVRGYEYEIWIIIVKCLTVRNETSYLAFPSLFLFRFSRSLRYFGLIT